MDTTTIKSNIESNGYTEIFELSEEAILDLEKKGFCSYAIYRVSQKKFSYFLFPRNRIRFMTFQIKIPQELVIKILSGTNMNALPRLFKENMLDFYMKWIAKKPIDTTNSSVILKEIFRRHALVPFLISVPEFLLNEISHDVHVITNRNPDEIKKFLITRKINKMVKCPFCEQYTEASEDMITCQYCQHKFTI